MFQEIAHTRYHPLSSQKALAAVPYALLLFVADSNDTIKVLFVSFSGFWLVVFFLKHTKAQEEEWSFKLPPWAVWFHNQFH